MGEKERYEEESEWGRWEGGEIIGMSGWGRSENKVGGAVKCGRWMGGGRDKREMNEPQTK